MRRKVQGGRHTIRAVSAYNSSSEINHDPHGVWLILAMIGGGLKARLSREHQKHSRERGRLPTMEFKPR